MTEIFEATETDKKRAADELNEPEDTSQATTNTKKIEDFWIIFLRVEKNCIKKLIEAA